MPNDTGDVALRKRPVQAMDARPPLRFAAACRPGEDIRIAAVGDVLLHSPLQKQAGSTVQGHESLWEQLIPLLKRADVTYGNFEGASAAGVAQSSYPSFNYNTALGKALKDSGFSVVSTANNHALDKGSQGVDRTLDTLEGAGLKHTGTRRATDTAAPWHTITETHGKKIAWLACTWGTNGIPDGKGQVLNYRTDPQTLERLVRELSGRPDIAAVIVTPHWGDEYHTEPNREQVALGHRLLDAGAAAIIGSHPHVLEPLEKYVTKDGRETLVAYSMGNFVSGQPGLEKRTSMLLDVTLRMSGSKAAVAGVRYVPLYMENAQGRYEVVPAAADPFDPNRAGEARRFAADLLGKSNEETLPGGDALACLVAEPKP